MMPKWLAVPVLIGAGIIVLRVAYRGYQEGDLPVGTNFFRQYRPNRIDNPFTFRFFLLLYFCMGTWLCTWGLLAMVGLAPSLRWH